MGKGPTVPSTLRYMFSRTEIFSQQLWSWCRDATKPLHIYPEAWVEMPEYAFSKLVEIDTEGIHRLVRELGKCGLKTRYPGNVCGRIRAKETFKMVENQDAMDWFCNEWSSKSLTYELLSHLCSKEEVQEMSFAQRYARIYQYSLDDKSLDATDQQTNVEAMSKIRADAAEPAPVTNSATDAFIEFCKSRLERGQVYSVPSQLMCKDDDALALVGAPAVTDIQLLEAISPPPGGGAPPAPRGCTYFQVIAPRLERQQMQKQFHFVDNRKHCILISVHNRYWMDLGSVCLGTKRGDTSLQRLDLRRLCLDGLVGPFPQNLHCWSIEVGQTSIALRRPMPRLREVPTVFPSLPDADDDAIPLAQLLDQPRHDKVANAGEATFSLAYVTPAMQEAMDMLHSGGYMVESDKWLRASDVNIPGFVVFQLALGPQHF